MSGFCLESLYKIVNANKFVSKIIIKSDSIHQIPCDLIYIYLKWENYATNKTMVIYDKWFTIYYFCSN